MEQVREGQVQLEVENIGGIDSTEVTFEPGVTVLSGRNATNRTSLLQAVMATLGSERVSLKGDAETGSATLRVGGETYTQNLERRGSSIVFDGDPYLDNPELANLFAFLLESNEARRTVALGENLRDIVMRPVDADEIKAAIRRLQAEKSDIEEQIEERDALEEKLPALEQQRQQIEKDIETKQAELEQKREELDELSKDPDQARSEQSELEKRMETLREKRSNLDDLEFRLQSQRDSLNSLQNEREDLEAQVTEFDSDETTALDDINAELERLRERKHRLDTELSKLQNVIQFNDEMLEGTHEDITAALQGDEEDSVDAVTEKLLESSDTVVCWTCGTEVERERIEETLDRLRSLRTSKYSEYQKLEDEITALKEKQSTIESRREQRQKVESQLENVLDEIEEREMKIDELEAERENLLDEIDKREDQIDELEQQDHSEILAVHREVNELEVELDRLESERERIEENMAEIEAQIDQLEDLELQKENIQAELQERRTRIKRIENEAIEQFNTHMETVLNLLDYKNIERIWIERIADEAGGNSRQSTNSEFRLHVVRSTADGVTYEDDFEHLSESEQEVTGLVFALAGYLTHDVHEIVPFMLLDSLEAIDSERIATLIEYFSEYAEYLITALLPEDADALSGEYRKITEI